MMHPSRKPKASYKTVVPRWAGLIQSRHILVERGDLYCIKGSSVQGPLNV